VIRLQVELRRSLLTRASGCGYFSGRKVPCRVGLSTSRVQCFASCPPWSHPFFGEHLDYSFAMAKKAAEKPLSVERAGKLPKKRQPNRAGSGSEGLVD